MKLHDERIQTETEPKREVIQAVNIKHLCMIFDTTDSAALTAEKYDFNSERAPNFDRFRAGLQDVLSAYKELYDRKTPEDKQSNILLYFRLSTHQPQQMMDLDVEAGRHRRCNLPALMESDNNDDNRRSSPLPYTTPISCISHLPIL